MKSKIKNSVFAVLGCCLLFSACTEEQRGQFPIDSTAPQQVSKPAVANFPGGATITYQLPDESDLLYVKAIYQLPDGSTQQVKSSVFSNSVTVKGYGRSIATTVKLVSVDRSQNESQPLVVDIHPEDSPIYAILESLNIEEGWGGFSVEWQNPLKEDIVFTALRQTDAGTFESVENIYSSTANVLQAIRGQEAKKSNFAFCIRDFYGNYSDTLKMALTPWFETQLDKSKFIGLPLSNKFVISQYGTSNMGILWDDVLIDNVGVSLYYLNNANTSSPVPVYFSLDLGVKAKLSRFRFFGRADYYFRLHNPKYIQIFGTNDPDIANNPESPESDWIMLSPSPYFESIRPSGKDNTVAAVEGDEDYTYASAGEEFVFPLDVAEIRYFRFKSITSWTGSTSLTTSELRFWGNPNVE